MLQGNDTTIELTSTFTADSYIALFELIYGSKSLIQSTNPGGYGLSYNALCTMLPILNYYNVQPYLQDSIDIATINVHTPGCQALIDLSLQYNSSTVRQAYEHYIERGVNMHNKNIDDD